MNKMKFIYNILIFVLLVACDVKPKAEQASNANNKEQPPQTIMAIFAHPDDETTIGPVLARYAIQSDVYLVVATDGRYGATDHSGLSAGDSLVAVRTEETKCACKELGINPPHFLGTKDGLGLNGHHDFYEEIVILKEGIKEKISELDPDVILTFGPDGDTGHPDHRLVGMATQEILLREGWADKIDLFHFGWTKEQTKKFPKDWGLGHVHPDYLNTAIRFSPEEEEKAFASLRCHISQFPEKVMDDWIDAERSDTTNVLYFRKFNVDTTKIDNL